MQLEDPDREGRAFMRRDTLTDEEGIKRFGTVRRRAVMRRDTLADAEGINRFGTVRRGVDWRYFVVDS